MTSEQAHKKPVNVATVYSDELQELTELRDGFIALCPIDRWVVHDHAGFIVAKRTCPREALKLIRLLRRGWRSCETAMQVQAIKDGGDELRRRDARKREVLNA